MPISPRRLNVEAMQSNAGLFDPAVQFAGVAKPPFQSVVSRTESTRATSIGHHGEILQGVFEHDGRLARGLVTLAIPMLRSIASFRPGPPGPLTVKPGWKTKALRAAEMVLERVGCSRGGCVQIESSLTPRWGFGSSTSDVVATVRAVAEAVGARVSPDEVAAIAVAAETASDSTMYNERAVLFAQREGAVLADLGSSLPSMFVVGFNTDPTEWGVDTIKYPPAHYSWAEIEAFRPLLGLLRKGVREQNAAEVGRVATASARINQSHLPKPKFDILERITERCGCLGLQVAHSGSVAGFLLADDEFTVARGRRVRSYLGEAGFESSWFLANNR